MTTVIIPLDKNPEIADLVADMQPGDKIKLFTAIKSKDEATLALTVESAEEGASEADADEETEVAAKPAAEEPAANPFSD